MEDFLGDSVFYNFFSAVTASLSRDCQSRSDSAESSILIKTGIKRDYIKAIIFTLLNQYIGKRTRGGKKNPCAQGSGVSRQR